MNKTENGEWANKAAQRSRRRSGRRGAVAFALSLLACFSTGCSLALEEVSAQEEDRLAGILITEQYLHKGMPELKLEPGGKVTFAEQDERIFGTLVYDQYGPDGVIFEGIEGYLICDLKMREEESGSYTAYAIADDIFSDGYWASESTDSGNTESVEATVYVEQGGIGSFYFNPIYQTSAGEVYLLPGSGLTSGTRTDGESMSHNMSWERTLRKGDEEKKGESTGFTIHITYADWPVAQKLLFFREDGTVLGSMSGEELAKIWNAGLWELQIPAQTAWLVLEQEESGGETVRTFCNRGDEKLEFLQKGGNGYLIKQSVSLYWE